MIIPKKLHSKRKFVSTYLNLNREPTFDDLHTVKKDIERLIHSEDLTPTDIQELVGIEHSNFTMLLKDTIGVRVRNHSEALTLYNEKIGRALTDAKKIFRKNCQFEFDPYIYTKIPGYNLLIERGMYHPTENPIGVCRDHMLSVFHAYTESFDPEHISHPANCQFITNSENIKKGEASILTYEDLLDRISAWDTNNVPLKTSYKRLPKSDEHKRKLSEQSKKYMMVTNGKTNKRILKTDLIPDGYWRGMTRFK